MLRPPPTSDFGGAVGIAQPPTQTPTVISPGVSQVQGQSALLPLPTFEDEDDYSFEAEEGSNCNASHLMGERRRSKQRGSVPQQPPAPPLPAPAQGAPSPPQYNCAPLSQQPTLAQQSELQTSGDYGRELHTYDSSNQLMALPRAVPTTVGPLGDAGGDLSMPNIQSDSQLEIMMSQVGNPLGSHTNSGSNHHTGSANHFHSHGGLPPTHPGEEGPSIATGNLVVPNYMREKKPSFNRSNLGNIRRVADLKSNTFALANQSVTSPIGILSLTDDPRMLLSSSDLSNGSTGGLPTSPTTPSPMPPKIPVVRSLQEAVDNTLNKRPVGSVFSLFGSLERKVRLSEISEIFKRHIGLLEPFLKSVFSIDNVFPPDFNILLFLRDPSKSPDDEFFDAPMVSWPLATLFLVMLFFVTAQRVGYASLFQTLQQGGFLSLGKGVFAALAVAESQTEEDLIKNTSRYYRAAFCVGIVYQRKLTEVASLTEASPKKGFTVLLVNIPISTLQLIIDEVNCVDTPADDGPPMVPFSEVQITRVISSRSAVVVGHPLDLMRLDICLTDFAKRTGTKVHKDFLPTQQPENSPFYNQGLQYELLQLWLDMEFTIQSTDLKVPVFSPVNGVEWNCSSNLMMDIAGAVTCVPQDLTYSLQNLRDSDILLDYSASSMRIGQMIAWTRRSITCFAEPSDRVEVSILPSPRRSALGSCICDTLGKVAILNECLKVLPVEPKSSPPQVIHLGMSFISDVKLLIDLDPVTGGTSNADGSKGNSSAIDGLRSPEMSITSFPVQTLQHHRSARIMDLSSGSGIGSPRTMALSTTNFNVSMSHYSGGISASMMGTQDIISAAIKTQTINSERLAVVPSAHNRNVINVYQVSPLIRYLELQHRCVLTKTAVDFAERLSKLAMLDFPPYTLLLCPTLFQLLEFWDGLQFTGRLKDERNRRRQEIEGNRDAPPGLRSVSGKHIATRRKNQLKKAFDLIWGGSSQSPSPPAMPSPGNGGRQYPVRY